MIGTFNFLVLCAIGNFTCISWYILSQHTVSLPSVFFNILQLYEKYWNSYKGEEYVKKGLKFLPIYFNMARVILETLSESGSLWIFFFIFLLGHWLEIRKCWKKSVSGCNSIATKIHEKFRITLHLPFGISSKTFRSHLHLWESIILAYTMAVSQNSKYGKL